MITLEVFLQLPTDQVSRLVQVIGSKAVVFPINGTRRWFMLEHGAQRFHDPIAAYPDIENLSPHVCLRLSAGRDHGAHRDFQEVFLRDFCVFRG